MQFDPLLKPAEVMERLNISRAQLYRLIGKGEDPRPHLHQ